MEIQNKTMIIVLLMSLATVLIGITLSIDDSNNVELGKNELGNVVIEGPYGNTNSSDKVAFVIGVHPLESNSHKALLDYIRKNDKNLNKQYYIYIINVTKDKNDFDKGRLNGQILAKEYAVPDIINKNYSFVVDVHSNRGVYEEKNFIISPLNDLKSYEIGSKIIKNITDIKNLKFIPAIDSKPTSPDFISIPILKNGTPTIIYEACLNDSINVTNNNIEQFIQNLDKINFNY
jgi:hypothetical protein